MNHEENERVRTELGWDLVRAADEAVPSRAAQKPADPPKQDNQPSREALNQALLDGVVLGLDDAAGPDKTVAGVFTGSGELLYFTSFDEFLAWSDSEGGLTD